MNLSDKQVVIIPHEYDNPNAWICQELFIRMTKSSETLYSSQNISLPRPTVSAQKIMSHHLKTQNWRSDPCAQKAVLCPPRIDSVPSYTGFRGWFAAWNPTPVHGVVGCFLPVLPPPTGIFPGESQRRLVTILPLWLRNRLPVDVPFPGGSPHRYIR